MNYHKRISQKLVDYVKRIFMNYFEFLNNAANVMF